MTETAAPSSIRPAAGALRRAAFRPILILLTGFLVVSLAMEAVLIVQSATGTDVDIAIWIRCSLVLGSSIILLWIAVSAARGSRPALVRLRIISPIVVVAVVVIVLIPGFLPDWVRVEQAICGALVLPVAILANLPQMRAHFPKDA
ncbi:hypothetical protein [Leifsonia poae]|uniref:hypothetical protein n=1 Tax=Leifsonia poae TaxID=110933 RepID=UPI003D6749F6